MMYFKKIGAKMTQIKLGIVGISGKMGSKVVELAQNDPNFVIIGGISKDETDTKVAKYENYLKLAFDSDVIIDFSRPEASISAVQAANKNKKPIVIGTTGFSEKDLGDIAKAAENIAIFKASNFSLGINIIKEILQQFSKNFLENYDVEIHEIHHRNKVDAPSGTALSLAKILTNFSNTNCQNNIVLNDFSSPIRQNNSIGISFSRGGGIVGEHKISCFGDFETIEITHRAMDRKIFAHGALMAAKWILSQKSGIYDMCDMLKS